MCGLRWFLGTSRYVNYSAVLILCGLVASVHAAGRGAVARPTTAPSSGMLAPSTEPDASQRNSASSIEQASFEARMNDPRQFARLLWDHGLSYTGTRARFNASHLGQFYPLLRDPEYRAYWGNTSKIIAFIGREAADRDKSTAVLLEYFRRPEEWKQGRQPMQVAEKINALELVGLVGGTAAEPTLLKALTREGAAEIAGEWINGPAPSYYPGTREQAIELIQGRAAKGMIYLRQPEGLAMIERMHHELDADATLRRTKHLLYDGVGSALAVRDYIADTGIDEYLKGWGENPVGGIMKLQPYLKKYDAYYRNAPAAAGR